MPGERFGYLTRQPACSGMFRDIESNNLPAVVGKDQLTNSSRNVAEGTMNMSMAAMPIAWLRRKLRQLGDGECDRRSMYLATVA